MTILDGKLQTFQKEKNNYHNRKKATISTGKSQGPAILPLPQARR
jgi:hypothetical protein